MWQWHLESLMEAHGIRKALTLADRIRAAYPEAAGNFAETTARMILSHNIDRISQTGLIVICQFFRLKSLSQLVDFEDAPIPPDRFWDTPPKLQVVLKLQAMLNAIEMSQKDLSEQSSVAKSTVNRLCRGINGDISFVSLGLIAQTLREATFDIDEQISIPRSITELIEIQPASMPVQRVLCRRYPHQTSAMLRPITSSAIQTDEPTLENPKRSPKQFRLY